MFRGISKPRVHPTADPDRPVSVLGRRGCTVRQHRRRDPATSRSWKPHAGVTWVGLCIVVLAPTVQSLNEALKGTLWDWGIGSGGNGRVDVD